MFGAGTAIGAYVGRCDRKLPNDRCRSRGPRSPHRQAEAEKWRGQHEEQLERSADPSSVEIDLMYVLVMVDASEFSAPMPSGWVRRVRLYR